MRRFAAGGNRGQEPPERMDGNDLGRDEERGSQDGGQEHAGAEVVGADRPEAGQGRTPAGICPADQEPVLLPGWENGSQDPFFGVRPDPGGLHMRLPERAVRRSL